MALKSQYIKLSKLLLWDENARFPDKYYNSDEKEMINYFLNNKKFQIRKLIQEIALDFDLIQLEKLVVWDTGESLIVIEGNRRLTAFKLLINPDLAENSSYSDFIANLKNQIQIDEDFSLECIVSDEESECLRYIDRKHIKNNNEVSWEDGERANYDIRRGNKSEGNFVKAGIINAGLMGGQEQNGNYLMDCRFNKADLIKRIQLIASRKKDIRLYKKDAIKLIEKVELEAKTNNVIFYFDPPYYLKASTLYMNHYKEESHKNVSDKIKSIKNIKWIVSYDNVPQIQELYSECNKKEYSFKHTAYKSRKGKEILFFSPELTIPDLENRNPINYKLKKRASSFDIIYK